MSKPVSVFRKLKVYALLSMPVLDALYILVMSYKEVVEEEDAEEAEVEAELVRKPEWREDEVTTGVAKILAFR